MSPDRPYPDLNPPSSAWSVAGKTLSVEACISLKSVYGTTERVDTGLEAKVPSREVPTMGGKYDRAICWSL